MPRWRARFPCDRKRRKGKKINTDKINAEKNKFYCILHLSASYKQQETMMVWSSVDSLPSVHARRTKKSAPDVISSLFRPIAYFTGISIG